MIFSSWLVRKNEKVGKKDFFNDLPRIKEFAESG